MLVPGRLFYPSLIWVRAGAYTRVEHVKVATLKLALVLHPNFSQGWKALLGGKHSSLMWPFVIYGRKKFYNIWPGVNLKHFIFITAVGQIS